MATAGPSLRGEGPSRHGDPSYRRSLVGIGQVIGAVANPYPHLVAVDPTARAQASVSG